MRLLSFLVLGSMGAALGCGTPAPPPATATPPASANPATDAEKPPAVEPSAKPNASAKPDASAKADTGGDAKPKWVGPAHWKGFPGPKVAVKITTKYAWGLIPIGLEDDFSIVKLELLSFVRAQGDEQVLRRIGDEEIFVPSAVTHPAEPAKGLTKGAAMMVNVAASYGFGRVTAIEKSDDETRVKFQYVWGSGASSDGELPLEDVIKLEDKVAFGHPVAFKSGDDWNPGVLAYADKDTTWIIRTGASPEQVPLKDVKAMKVSKPFKKGDKVWAYEFALVPATIVEVQDGGVAYKVKFDKDGKVEQVGLERVTAPL